MGAAAGWLPEQSKRQLYHCHRLKYAFMHRFGTIKFLIQMERYFSCFEKRIRTIGLETISRNYII